MNETPEHRTSDLHLTATGLLAEDADFKLRVAASAATLQVPQTPPLWADLHAWWIAASPGFAAAYSYALGTNVAHPGRDVAVISDGQIHAAVQKRIDDVEQQQAARGEGVSDSFRAE